MPVSKRTRPAEGDGRYVVDGELCVRRGSSAVAASVTPRGMHRRRRWRGYTHGWGCDAYPLADNWRGSIERFYDLGVPPEDIADCVRIALTNSRIHYDDAYRYFAGCVWRVVTEMQEAAKELLAGEEGA